MAISHSDSPASKLASKLASKQDWADRIGGVAAMRRVQAVLVLGVVSVLGLVGLLTSGAIRLNHAGEPGGRLAPELAAILAKPAKVSAYLIQPNPGMAKEKENAIAGHAIIATSKADLGEATAKALAKLLDSKHAYDGMQARCFLPGVAFRVQTANQERADLLLCFSCTNFRAICYAADGKETRQISGAFGQTPAYRQFLDLALAAFPDNAELLKLAKDAKGK
jgi:hypothetical protein